MRLRLGRISKWEYEFTPARLEIDIFSRKIALGIAVLARENVYYLELEVKRYELR